MGQNVGITRIYFFIIGVRTDENASLWIRAVQKINLKVEWYFNHGFLFRFNSMAIKCSMSEKLSMVLDYKG